jgi:uncharacterized protein (TIGR02231 family)
MKSKAEHSTLFSASFAAPMARSSQLLERSRASSAEDDDVGNYGGEPRGIQAQVAAVKASADGIGTAAFTIPRSSSVPSDNKAHKSTVAILNLQAAFIHYAAPAVSSYAYLLAKTTNTSTYALLPSDKANVFLDGNFVATTSLKSYTSPGETFNNFLGVDNSVKIQYHPSKEGGLTEDQKWFAISNSNRRRYDYTTVLHNTRSSPTRVILADVLPSSTNERIKIDLLEPESLHTVSGLDTAGEVSEEGIALSLLDQLGATSDDLVTQNKFTNNIVWLKTLPAGKKVEVKFSYRVTWPADQGQITIS